MRSSLVLITNTRQRDRSEETTVSDTTIAMVVQLDAQPLEPACYLPSDAMRVLAYATAEDQGVDPAQDRGHRAQLPANTKHEIIDSLSSFGRVGCLQHAHVVTDTTR